MGGDGLEGGGPIGVSGWEWSLGVTAEPEEAPLRKGLPRADPRIAPTLKSHGVAPTQSLGSLDLGVRHQTCCTLAAKPHQAGSLNLSQQKPNSKLIRNPTVKKADIETRGFTGNTAGDAWGGSLAASHKAGFRAGLR